ncbi:hypothetical protein [Pyrococcus kukulkanii]|uniref:Uncharacterized protein n=1 Tax=Pyrococcus kukulkanii TaxID=1609559 RepID=A0A127B8F5_9EURY|nr:hypothetical protein [Pyrococcus kukulkanii]AMM53457.1 hypothetical protein TQ32_02340 [Pyrococcus kukulkanii]
MSDVERIVKNKFREAVRESLADSYREFLIKEFVEQRKYKELLGLWLFTNIGIGYDIMKIFELTCYREGKCYELEFRNEIIKEGYFKGVINNYLQRVPEGKVLSHAYDYVMRNVKPKNIIEKQYIEASLQKLLKELEQDIKNAKNGSLSYNIEEIAKSAMGRATDDLLRNIREVREYFEKKVNQSLNYLSLNGKFALLVISMDYKFIKSRTLKIFDQALSGYYSPVVNIILQTFDVSLGFSADELIAAGLLAEGWGSSRKHSWYKYVIPPFALEIWRTAPYNPEIIKDIPPELVKRVRTILSWREENAGGND